MDFVDSVKAARRVSTPILAVQTADQQAIQARLVAACNGSAPCVRHDVVKGFAPLNDAGLVVVAGLGDEERQESVNPVTALVMAEKFPSGTMLLLHNAHRYLNQEPAVSQAIANLRDKFKSDRRTLVLMGPHFTLPSELQPDVVTLSEELPCDEALREISWQLFEAAGLASPTIEILDRTVDTVRGLSAFAAEQVIAMSLTKAGIDLDAAWERKRAAVNQTPGLSIARSSVTFDSIGGQSQVIKFARAFQSGPRAPRVIVRVEEIEKMVAGAGFGSGVGDSSGVSQYQIGKLLTAMEEKSWTGLIATGPAGCGKSLMASAWGGTFGLPTIELDLGAMKGSLVGESEANTNRVLDVIEAIGGDRVLLVATCNRLEALPAELRRRFRLGVWYFDLPTDGEKPGIWKLQRKAHSIPPQYKNPPDKDWTGAEIRNACEQAFALDIGLIEAAEFVIPMMVSQPEVVDKLRRIADGRFFNAAAPGAYRYKAGVNFADAADGGRKIALKE